MLVRFAKYTEQDLYRFYNLGDDRCYGDLPPPPNPDKLQRFYMQCVEQIIIDKNKENAPPEKQDENPGFRRRMTP